MTQLSEDDGSNVKLSFVGANPNPRIEPIDRLEKKVSYFIGNDPEKWRPDVPVWGGVRYVDLYPGVDLEVSSQGTQWTWRAVASDESALAQMKLVIDGAGSLSLDDDEVVGSPSGIEIPLMEVDESVETAFPSIQGNSIVSPFTRKLVISHQQSNGSLVFSTFLGGNALETGNTVTTDDVGNAYIIGTTRSSDFPTTTGVFSDTLSRGIDTFVTKINPNGSTLIYSAFIGGSADDLGSDIAVDAEGYVYLAGETRSWDFPTTPGAFDVTHNGGATFGDAFVTKLLPNASVYHTAPS